MHSYTIEEIENLTQRFGSPLYVFRKDDFIANYKRFNDCFKSIYPKYQLSYSYKTNYTPYICKLVKTLGGYAEVVSDMELSVARIIGYEYKQIVYNGPYKGDKSLDLLLGGGILNVDNFDELRTVISCAENNPDKQFQIGLRVNINIGQAFVSRFGIDADGDELSRAFHLVENVHNLDVAGLHCHIGQSRSIQAWRNRAKIMIELADKYFERPPKFIDLGSGMFARMEPSLAVQFGNEIPSFEEYADALLLPFVERYKDTVEEERPVVITEPGTTLVNSYIDFIGQISAIKRIKGKEYAVMDCGKFNLGEICTLKELPIQLVAKGVDRKQVNDISFVGYTCLEHDVMYEGYSGALAVGDYIVFGNVGGYSNVSKPPFISPNCAMINMDAKGETELIKRIETFEDVFGTYVF